MFALSLPWQIDSFHIRKWHKKAFPHRIDRVARVRRRQQAGELQRTSAATSFCTLHLLSGRLLVGLEQECVRAVPFERRPSTPLAQHEVLVEVELPLQQHGGGRRAHDARRVRCVLRPVVSAAAHITAAVRERNPHRERVRARVRRRRGPVAVTGRDRAEKRRRLDPPRE